VGGKFSWQPGRAEFLAQSCPLTSCELLPESDLALLPHAHAVLFKGEFVEMPTLVGAGQQHVVERNPEGATNAKDGEVTAKKTRRLRKMRPDQVWIYYSLESVAALRKMRSASWPAEVFNWTATYRQSSSRTQLPYNLLSLDHP
jgi:hypothetical protein